MHIRVTNYVVSYAAFTPAQLVARNKHHVARSKLLVTQTLLGSLQRSPDPIAGGERCPLPKNPPSPALCPSCLDACLFSGKTTLPLKILAPYAYGCGSALLNLKLFSVGGVGNAEDPTSV